MCYRALTYNVKILVWLYILILWERKVKKDLLPFELSKMKNLQVPLGCTSHALDPSHMGIVTSQKAWPRRKNKGYV